MKNKTIRIRKTKHCKDTKENNDLLIKITNVIKSMGYNVK